MEALPTKPSSAGVQKLAILLADPYDDYYTAVCTVHCEYRYVALLCCFAPLLLSALREHQKSKCREGIAVLGGRALGGAGCCLFLYAVDRHHTTDTTSSFIVKQIYVIV